MRNNSTLDWLEAQLQNTLTPTARRELENKLLHDPAFKREFATLLAIRRATREKERTFLRQRYFNQKNRKSPWKWAAVASFVVALLLAWFLLRPSNSISTQELYTLYEQKENIDLTNRSEGDALLSQAANHYKNDDFEAAVNRLDAYLLSAPDDLQILLYKGMALRNVKGEELAAISIFESLEGNPIFRQEALWQKALVYFKLGDLASCRAILGKMKGARAGELLDMLPSD